MLLKVSFPPFLNSYKQCSKPLCCPLFECSVVSSQYLHTSPRITDLYSL